MDILLPSFLRIENIAQSSVHVKLFSNQKLTPQTYARAVRPARYCKTLLQIQVSWNANPPCRYYIKKSSLFQPKIISFKLSSARCWFWHVKHGIRGMPATLTAYGGCRNSRKCPSPCDCVLGDAHVRRKNLGWFSNFQILENPVKHWLDSMSGTRLNAAATMSPKVSFCVLKSRFSF